MRDRAKLLRIVDRLFQSKPDKRHRSVGVAAIGRFDFSGKEIEGVKPAETELQIVRNVEFSANASKLPPSIVFRPQARVVDQYPSFIGRV